jgi:hypothetical protein
MRFREGTMTADVIVRPLTIPEAARAVREAQDAVGGHGQYYARQRTGLDIRATTRAHSELGFAVLEFVNACVALAEAEDRIDPVWAAARNRSQSMSTAAGPSHDQAWRDYQDARRSGDRHVIAAARGVWRDAFVDWQLQLHKRRAAEDQERVEKLSRRLDGSTRLHPADAFPPPPSSRAQEGIQVSRERQRRESIQRATRGLSTPWIRWQRGGQRRSTYVGDAEADA